MIWLYILIYFLGAIGTGLWVYILLIKKYKKENTALKFSVWIESYDIIILLYALFWFIVLPIGIIVTPIKRIVERINKHYNVEL
jgi:hypothetical protein